MKTQKNARPVAVHSIDHFALNVPSLADAERFFGTFGLAVERIAEGLDLRAGDGHRWARVLPAAHKSMAYLSFNCYEQDFAAIEAKVKAAGASLDAAAPGCVAGDGIWFRDPDGNLLQVRVGAKCMPDDKSPLVSEQVPANARGANTRATLGTVRPRRLSHVLLFTPDTARAVGFYGKALGLKLSDKAADIIAFTHAPHGSDHHLVAFVKSGAKGWHHASWEVASLDEVGRGAAQMAAAGFSKGWGTGRHVLGSNYFNYVEDPWGSFCEYSAGIDYISSGSEWPAGDHQPEDSFYQWGPDVPDNFVINTEA